MTKKQLTALRKRQTAEIDAMKAQRDRDMGILWRGWQADIAQRRAAHLEARRR